MMRRRGGITGRLAGAVLIVLGVAVAGAVAQGPTAGGNAWFVYAGDPGGYHMGWGSAHWVPSLGKMLVWGGNSHNYRGNNSIRAFDPRTNTWEILHPNSQGANGVQNRDNHFSFLVPGRGDKGEFWVIGGSYTTTPGGPPGTNFGGRFDLASRKWVVVAQSGAEFAAGLIRGFNFRGNNNGAMAWCPDIDTGVVVGGSAEGNPTNETQLIEPNPGGPEPYRYWAGVLEGSPPPRAQLRAQGVCVGSDFYVYGGMYQPPGGKPTGRNDLWKLHVPTRAWTQLPAGGPGGFQIVMTHDSRNNALVVYGGWGRNDVWVYHLDTRTWENMTPTMKPAGDHPWRRVNHVGVYVPTVNQHIYTGGNCWTADGADVPYSRCALSVGGYRYADGPARRSSPEPAPTASHAAAPAAAPAATAPAAPAPATAGTRIDLPLRTWVARPLPERGKGPCPVGGCKHMRLAHNPLNGRIYFLGGDYSGPGGQSSARNELYSYSIRGGDWALEYPYCGPPDQLQPHNPDEVGWAWDSKRSVFWVLPGFFWNTVQTCSNGARLTWGMLKFDPVARRWSQEPHLAPFDSKGGELGKFAVYDPARDLILMFRHDGGMGSTVNVLDMAKGRWRVVQITHDFARRPPLYLNDAQLSNEYLAADIVGRHIYVIDPIKQRLLRYDLDRESISYLGDLPAEARTAKDFTIPVWDSVNRVLLWPYVPNLDGHVTLYIYRPDTGTWEKDPMRQPDGLAVRGNSAVFDPAENALLLVGGLKGGDLDPSVRHMFLYRYGHGGAGGPR